MCAFLGSVPVPGKKGYGRVRFRVKALTHSTRVEPGVVMAIGQIDFEKKFHEEKIFNASGVRQLQALYQIDAASGVVELEIEEIGDDTASWQGAQTDVELVQTFPQGTTVGWQYLAAKARVEIIGLAPNVDGGMTRQKIRITPYNDSGTALFTFTDAWTPA